jgi:hypothetical protein
VELLYYVDQFWSQISPAGVGFAAVAIRLILSKPLDAGRCCLIKLVRSLHLRPVQLCSYPLTQTKKTSLAFLRKCSYQTDVVEKGSFCLLHNKASPISVIAKPTCKARVLRLIRTLNSSCWDKQGFSIMAFICYNFHTSISSIHNFMYHPAEICRPRVSRYPMLSQMISIDKVPSAAIRDCIVVQ